MLPQCACGSEPRDTAAAVDKSVGSPRSRVEDWEVSRGERLLLALLPVLPLQGGHGRNQRLCYQLGSWQEWTSSGLAERK